MGKDQAPAPTRTVEVRAFGRLNKIFKDQGWPFPAYIKLKEECTVRELAERLELPLDVIEAVFINGRVYSLEKGRVRPGDRIAFLPPGTPGPYRVMLGIVKE